MTALVYIGLGGNIGNSVQRLRDALRDLANVPGIRVQAVSRFVRSKPLGAIPQDDYINAVASLHTGLAPVELLVVLQSIENAHGRVRMQRWGARTLDLDILLYDERVINDAALTIPHPGIAERDFVLYPLREIAGGGLKIPGLGELEDMIARCPARELVYAEDGCPVRA